MTNSNPIPIFITCGLCGAKEEFTKGYFLGSTFVCHNCWLDHNKNIETKEDTESKGDKKAAIMFGDVELEGR